MSTRANRYVIRLTVALAATIALVLSPVSAPPADAASTRAKVTISVPAASVSTAKTAITAKTTGVTTGARVTLQQLKSAKWTSIKTVRLPKTKKATFIVAPPLGSVAYRVKAGSATSAVKRTTASPSVSKKVITKGERVTVRGAYGTTLRPVALQYKPAGKAWTTVARGKTTSKTGGIKLSVAPKSTGHIRLVLPKSGSKAAFISKAVKVTVNAKPALTLSVSGQSVSTVNTSVTVTATGLKVGTKVSVQKAIGSTWKTLGTRALTSANQLRFRIAPTLGTVSLRAVAGSTKSPVKKTVAVPALSLNQSVAGQAVSVKGSIDSGSRPVRIQYAPTGQGWQTIVQGTSSAKGAIAQTIEPTTSGRVRIHLPASGNHKAFTSGAVALSVSAQAVSFTMPDQAYRGEQITVTAIASPAKATRPMHLEVSDGETWQLAAEATQDAAGTATFTIGATAAGTYTHRVVAPAWKGLPAAASASRTIRIDEVPVEVSDDAVALAPEDGAAVTGWDDTTGDLAFETLPPSIAALTGGDVLVLPPSAATPGGLLRKVVGIDTENGQTIVRTESADLVDVIETAPGDIGAFSAVPLGEMAVTDVADGVEYVADEAAFAGARRVGIASVTGPRLNFAVDYTLGWEAPMPDGKPDVKVSMASKGNVSVAPTADFDLGTTWYGKVDRYQLGAGLDVNNSLVNTVSVAVEHSTDAIRGESEASKDLATISRQFVVSIGPVPVYINVTGKLLAEYSVSGKVGLKFRTTQVGRIVAGVENAPGGLDPKGYSTKATTSNQFLSVQASGEVSAFIGGELQIMLYGAIGPYLKAGLVGEGAIGIDSQQVFTCSFKVGPAAEVGIKTSDALKTLTGLSLTVAKWEFPWPGAFLDVSCPHFTDPQISTSSVPAATVGTSYTARFHNADGRDGKWTKTSGDLPAGLTLAEDGLLSGVPTVAGRKVFQITFTDDDDNSVTKSFTLTVAGAIGEEPGAGSGDVLVFGDSDNGYERDNMARVLSELGFNVDVATTVPEDLSSYASIWEIEAYEGFSDEESARVIDYINAGGSVYMTGERPCCEALNDSVESVLDGVLFNDSVQVGDAGDSPSSYFPVNPLAMENLAHNPNALTEFWPDAPGRLQSAKLTGVNSRNVFVSGDQGDIIAAAWRDNDMRFRKGRVVVIMDIDYLGRPHEEYSKVIENVATFLNRG